jgi:hypothetical protein
MRIAGDAAETLRPFLEPSFFLAPVEAEAVTCAVLAAKADPEDKAFFPRPLYLRPPDVTIQLCAEAR